MAYVFNGINSLLNGEEDKPSQTNIFAPEESQMGNAQSGEQMPGQQPKTSTEGELGGGGASTGTQGSEGKPQQTQSADVRLMQRNKVKEAPKFAKNAQGALGQAQTALQDEANSYVSQAKTKDYSIADQDVEKAISGDEETSGKVRSLLTGQADRAESFAPKTDYDIEDIYAMQTDAGIDSILRRESGPEYSTGEAAFDRSLLNRSAEFNQLRSLLKGQQEGLVKQADQWSGSEGEKSKEAQAAYDVNFAKARDATSGYLGSQSDTLRRANEAEAKAENEARAALRSGTNGKFIGEQAQKAMAKLIADYEGTDPNGVLKYIKSGMVDPSKYYQVAGDVGLEDAIDDSEATRFNSIMGLLGKQDNWAAGSGFGDRESFDSTKFSGDMVGAATKADLAANAKAQAEVDKIIAELKARPDSSVQSYRDNTIAQIRNSLKNEYGEDIWNFVDNISRESASGKPLDALQYYGDVSWEDLISDADLKRLNPYYTEMSKKNGLTAGSGINKAFNSDAYRAALVQALEGRRNEASVPYNDQTWESEMADDVKDEAARVEASIKALGKDKPKPKKPGWM